MAAGVASVGSPLPSYSLPVEALEYGASLGNAHTWLTTRGGGSIQEIYSIDTGRAVVGTVAVRYAVPTHLLVPPGTAGEHGGGAVALRPADPGTIEIHPAYQCRHFSLPGSIEVAETVFVPLTGDDDPTVAYYKVEIANAGDVASELAVYGHARLGGTAGADVAARWDGECAGAGGRGPAPMRSGCGCSGAALHRRATRPATTSARPTIPLHLRPARRRYRGGRRCARHPAGPRCGSRRGNGGLCASCWRSATRARRRPGRSTSRRAMGSRPSRRRSPTWCA